jgi:hypothetical protein
MKAQPNLSSQRNAIAWPFSVLENRSSRCVCNRDHCVNGVDIQAHVFMSFHVLVLVSGCSVTRQIHADRLPSPGVTRVTGDKHLFFRLPFARSYSV